MDPLQLGQSVARAARSRLTRRAALASSGAGLATALLNRSNLTLPALAAQDATPTGAQTGGNNEPPEVPAWMRTPGAEASPYGERAPAEEAVVRQVLDPADSFAPLADLHGIITPNALFYEVHYGGIPAIDPVEHRLMVHGLVERPLLFTMDDLKRFPSVSVTHFLECSGNSFFEWQEASIGATVSETHGLTSCAEWTGVPVAAILREAGIRPGAVWMLAEGADSVGHDRSIPVEKAMRDGILAYAANGEALRPSQGYPLRLLLPGYEGNTNVKWLRRLKLGDLPWQTRQETSHYTDLMPDGTARQFTFVMEAKSVITSPSGGQRLPGPGFKEITGLAWSGRGRIERVDITTDGGQSWTPAALQTPVLPMAWTRFRMPWIWDSQPARLQSRAIDETGYVQPTLAQLVEARGVNSFYHFNGIQTWDITADGEVTNVYA
ncbi:MAG: soxC [Thermomicrobiales bacterium]|jgi:sulfane dehydrogenase subunit SoxC|nr:soxC [Thermomicrobiales bacterium]MDF3039585.1 soxC [Thermomicrobiales bacterium]